MEVAEDMITSNIKEEIDDSPSKPDSIILQSNEKPLMHFKIETDYDGQIVNIKPTESNILFVDEASKTEIVSAQVDFDENTKIQIENLLREKQAKRMKTAQSSTKICEVCNKVFSTKYLLDRHSKIHTGEKTYSCTLCPKTFNQKNALECHIRTHSGTRPYACPYCPNTFAQSGNLKSHIKRYFIIY